MPNKRKKPIGRLEAFLLDLVLNGDLPVCKVAQEIGVPQVTLYLWTTEKRTLSTYHLEKLCDYYGIVFTTNTSFGTVGRIIRESLPPAPKTVEHVGPDGKVERITPCLSPKKDTQGVVATG